MSRIPENIIHRFRSHKCTGSHQNRPSQAQYRSLRQRCLSLAGSIRRLSGRQEQDHGNIHLLEERIRLLESLLVSDGCSFPPDRNMDAEVLRSCSSFPAYDYDDEELPFDSSGMDDGGEETCHDDYSGPAFMGCEQCDDLFGCYNLIDSLVRDILTLEEEMVNWRHALVRHLGPLDAQNLQADIFDHLARRYYDNETYQKYLKAFRYEEDPMESDEHTGKLWRLAHGTDGESANL